MGAPEAVEEIAVQRCPDCGRTREHAAVTVRDGVGEIDTCHNPFHGEPLPGSVVLDQEDEA